MESDNILAGKCMFSRERISRAKGYVLMVLVSECKSKCKSARLSLIPAYSAASSSESRRGFFLCHGLRRHHPESERCVTNGRSAGRIWPYSHTSARHTADVHRFDTNRSRGFARSLLAGRRSECGRLRISGAGRSIFPTQSQWNCNSHRRSAPQFRDFPRANGGCLQLGRAALLLALPTTRWHLCHVLEQRRVPRPRRCHRRGLPAFAVDERREPCTRQQLGAAPATRRATIARRQLRREWPDSPYLFVSERGGPMTASNVRKLVARAGLEAKLPFPVHPTC
jgi:hypothetical protein